MVRRIRVGLVGLGRLGRFHAQNLAGRVPAAELAMVVDAVEDAARSVGRELDVEWSCSIDDLLDDDTIEAVVIATPTPLHAGMIERAAESGKHIFCEKPLAFHKDPTVKAIEAASSAGVKLQVGFHRRFDPDWRAAVARMERGELGEVYLFRTSLRDMKPPSIEYIESSGGFFVDVTIHDFDTARWMIGEVDEVTSFGSSAAVPAIAKLGDIDTALVILRFASGALGVIDNTRAAGYGYECSTEVLGSKATARISHHRRAHVQWLTAGQATEDWVVDFTERYPDAYRLELDDFLTAVAEDRPVAVTGEDALAAFTLCKAAEESFRLGKTVKLEHRQRNGDVFYEKAGRG
ncbi:MAG: inositol 2-dehydrogenase [Actinomycetota bacterium]|nr:inositol 2-dehydrogenase [Actinomycetota bacterium]